MKLKIIVLLICQIFLLSVSIITMTLIQGQLHILRVSVLCGVGFFVLLNFLFRKIGLLESKEFEKKVGRLIWERVVWIYAFIVPAMMFLTSAFCPKIFNQNPKQINEKNV
ncbi:MAG: hypothetical protein ABFQ65_03785 [Nanoarchaeota archaeon]